MAREILVKLLADPSNLSRGYKTASKETTAFGKATEQVGKQVEGSRKTYEHLQRTIIGLTGVLAGGAGLEAGLRSTIEAARGMEEAQARLDVTMRDAGLSFDKSKSKIEEFIKSESRLSAFTQADLTDSFGSLVRLTKDTGKAMQDTALAADIARARHIDLAAATNIVIKAEEGMTGTLRRQGIDIAPVKTAEDALTDSHKHFTTAVKEQAKELDKHATSLKAIAKLTDTYRGSAASATPASEKFKNAVNELEVAVGQVLLPELNKMIQPLATWMQKMVDSGKAAHFAHDAVEDLKAALQVAKTVVDAARKTFDRFSDAVGGDKNAIKLLTAAAIAFKLKGAVAFVAGLTSIEKKSAEAAGAKGVGGLLGKVNALRTAAATPIAFAVLFDITSIFSTKGDQGPGPPGDRELGKQHDKFGFLHALETSNVAPKGALLAEYKAFREGKITAAQAEKWFEAHTGLFQQAGISLPASAIAGAGGFKGSKVQWSGDYAGLDSGFASKLEQAVAAAGGTAINVTSGRRSPSHNAAVHGAAELEPPDRPRRRRHLHDQRPAAYPLGNAPIDYGEVRAPRRRTFDWGGSPDIYHVDDNSNHGGATPTPPTTPTTGNQNDTTVADLVSQGTTTPKHKKAGPKGATVSTITSLEGSIAAELKALPKRLDPVEKNAVAHIKAIRDSLHVHMPDAELAKDRVELKKWGKVLSTTR
jgi:hypothetical protein